MTDSQGQDVKKKKHDPFWLIYLSLLLSGVLLISSAYHISHLSKWTAQIGITLVFTAFALLIGKGSKSGYAAVIIIWAAVIASFII